MPHHLESVPPGPPDESPGSFWPNDDEADPYEDVLGGLEDGDSSPVVRPTWWRWVAIAVIVAMVLAGPFAYALSKLIS